MPKRVTKFRERTLVVLKPDTIQRGLMGEIISRFEKVGLKIVGMKFVWITEEMAQKHYSVGGDEWLEMVGSKSREAYKKQGIELTETNKEIGMKIRKGLEDYMSSGPVLAMVLEGDHVIKFVRKVVGATEPMSSEMGSIRGDFAFDTYQLSDIEERPIRNLIHASGSIEDAEKEIPIWFSKNEIFSYTLIIEKILYGPHYSEPGEM